MMDRAIHGRKRSAKDKKDREESKGEKKKTRNDDDLPQVVLVSGEKLSKAKYAGGLGCTYT